MNKEISILNYAQFRHFWTFPKFENSFLQHFVSNCCFYYDVQFDRRLAFSWARRFMLGNLFPILPPRDRFFTNENRSRLTNTLNRIAIVFGNKLNLRFALSENHPVIFI